MGVLNYMTISSTATAPHKSKDPPRQPKIVLPKKKGPKWTTGMGPGEYGGPPTTTKLRKYWGGANEDPLATDDFMWNQDFMGRMQKFIQDPDPSLQAPPKKELPSGFLSLNRVMSLDSLEVDLSKQLTTPAKPVLVPKVEAAPKNDGKFMRRWRLAPTRREQDKWDRAQKAANEGTEVLIREIKMPRGDPQVLAAEAREQYFKLKNQLQTLTLAIGGVGLVCSYVSYSPEITTSFGAGFLGSLAYVRMLGSSVDALADGAKGLVKGAVAQPRILVPVILVMIYNRWNGILVPEYGFMHLELIPMLVGFFSYKVATFVQAIEAALPNVENETKS